MDMHNEELIKQYNELSLKKAKINEEVIQLTAEKKAREEERGRLMKDLEKYGVTSAEELRVKIESLTADIQDKINRCREEFKKLGV